MHRTYVQMPRPSRPTGYGTQSTSMPASGSSSQYSEDPSRWHSNLPDTYATSVSSGTGDWFAGSVAMPWAQPNKPSNPSFIGQSTGTFAVPNRFPTNPAMSPGYQQQNPLSSQTAAGMSKPVEAVMPVQSQPDLAGGNVAFGWNKDAAVSQWQQMQSQWSWPQNDSQSSQPVQYMVCYVDVYLQQQKPQQNTQPPPLPLQQHQLPCVCCYCLITALYLPGLA